MQPNVYERLNALEKIGIKLGLQNIQTLLAGLGNPENSFPSILIAGTNGKGSVGAMLHQILQQNGIRAGHYTSPHLVDVRERIRIGAQLISEAKFEESLTRLFVKVDELLAAKKLEHPPTYFEMLTALAFLTFAESKIEYAVVEVGMGGRFDATNVLLPKIGIITTIGFDHQEYLGNSLAEIAFEKAGIIKPDVPVVLGKLPAEAETVIQKRAAEAGASVNAISRNDIADLELENGRPVFVYRPWNAKIHVALAGEYQAENASVALLASRILSENGLSLKVDTTIEALRNVRWPGRLERIDENPPTLIDCAHNPMGAVALSEFLDEIGWSKCVVLFAAMKDKDFKSMMKQIAPKTAHMIVTRIAPFERSAPVQILAAAAADAQIAVETYEAIGAAIMRAKGLALETNSPLVIFGSIYLIGEILRFRAQSIN